MPGWSPGMPKDGMYTRLLATKATSKRPSRPYGWTRPIRRKSTTTFLPVGPTGQPVLEFDKAVIDVLS